MISRWYSLESSYVWASSACSYVGLRAVFSVKVQGMGSGYIAASFSGNMVITWSEQNMSRWFMCGSGRTIGTTRAYPATDEVVGRFQLHYYTSWITSRGVIVEFLHHFHALNILD